MSIDSLRKSIAEETMFPPRTPFFPTARETSRFPAPLSAHAKEAFA